MQTPTRYILVVLAVVVSFHFIISFTHESYGRATSLFNIASHFGSQHPEPYLIPDDCQSNLNTSSVTRANATFVILARNSDLEGVVRSMRDVEDRFNRRYGYPWVLLNDDDFTEDFKKRVSVIASSSIEFGRIPHDDWFQPDWIDEKKATMSRNKMAEDQVIYGDSVSYRNMCRFNSGFFYRQKLMQKYRYYWRVEPDIHIHCDIHFDPFLFMQNYGKVYGFTITMYEYEATIKTLWSSVKEFISLHPEYVSPDNAMRFMSDNGGDTFNLCHFWSNFEIADMDFWRGEAYSAFFKFLDSKGGFYYERWGDAPVHSIAAALFARKDQIHFFEQIGYEHNPYVHCPKRQETWAKGKCGCDQARNFDYDGYSCMTQWERLGV